jgi:uncharacterized protein YerC
MIRSHSWQKDLARSLLLQGNSVRKVASAVRMSTTWVYFFAKDERIPLRSVRVSMEKRQTLVRQLSSGETLVKSALAAGVSTTTAHRVRRQIESSDVPMAFNRTRSAKRCPVHGLVNVLPCVACAAEASGRMRQRSYPCG